MNTIKPLGDKLLVKRDESDTQTESGIYIPPQGEEKKYFGEVLEVGPSVHDIEKGDRILFGKYDGVEFDFEGEKVLFLYEDDVIAVVE